MVTWKNLYQIESRWHYILQQQHILLQQQLCVTGFEVLGLEKHTFIVVIFFTFLIFIVIVISKKTYHKD